MNVNGKQYRTIWLKEPGTVEIINQAALPFRFETLELRTVEDVRRAIKDMYVRGAGLIGAAAAFGMYLAALEAAQYAAQGSFEADLRAAAAILKNTRPTASNLAWAVDRMLAVLTGGAKTAAQIREAALEEAQAIADEDAEFGRKIGLHGLEIIRAIAEKKRRIPGADETVHILTHCNAGWLAFVDYGSALSPVYAAFDRGVKVHVWVDETRPRNQGASLTAWELDRHGVSYDLIPDNAGGHLLQRGMADLVITGADRVTRRGDAANKIGTYLKAAAAKENGVPFYVALPSSTFDFDMADGVAEIPIEERDASEVRYITGMTDKGSLETVRICPEAAPARNFGFDVTPARYITALITDRGICGASEAGILALYPERAAGSKKVGEGYVKYGAEHTYPAPAEAVPAEDAPHWDALNDARTTLHRLGLVGLTPQGVGFGNVSVRVRGEEFLISGTATGAARTLGPHEYCLVRSFDPAANRVVTFGPVKASSESMTHGAIYRAAPAVRCVIHVHSRPIFDGMLRDRYPATPAEVEYGTPEMAAAVEACVRAGGADAGVIVLTGHDEGVLSYGPSVGAALKLIEALYDKYC
ncbi:MAG: S-methyl-5-thioribose-1-phosphate isomerase [Treponema sp.]|jgi:methylthioribose-1-phosphate isomerase|nr:S-methyl-5-thioribose-1-phosphate isomerase [Treponema sp.]